MEEGTAIVDGKCNCCPYGYHVDVDFMSYCDTLSNQSYLKVAWQTVTIMLVCLDQT